MSLFESPSKMTARSRGPLIEKPSDLMLPEEPENPVAQKFDFDGRPEILIFTPDRKKSGLLVPRGVEFDQQRGRLHSMHLVGSDYVVRISDYQLASLYSSERLRVPHPNLPGKVAFSTLGLTPEQIADAEITKGYVEAALDLATLEGKNRPTTGTIKRAAALHALKMGHDAPRSVNNILKYIEQRKQWPDNDIRAYVKARPPGKTEGDYGKDFEEIVRRCVITIWSKPKPTYRKLKRLLVRVLLREHPGLVAIRKRVMKDGFLVPSDAYFQRAKKALNRYDRDRENFGKGRADVTHRGRTSRPRATLPLEVVEVDYTVLDIVAVDHRFKFIWGRPHLIMFRDQATGCLLGFAIFFENLSFETFLHGFRQAIYPKDMSPYPKTWRWDMFGWMSSLIIDNELHLIAETAVTVMTAHGVTVEQMNVHHAWMKGGIEQAIGKSQEAVIHDLKGSVHASPELRDLYDKDKLAGKPHYGLDHIEAKIVEYIVNDVHTKPIDGVGIARRTNDIRSDLWMKGIAHAKARPLLNPDEFLRLVSPPKQVTVKGNQFVLDSIVYESPMLVSLLVDPRHNTGERTDQRKTKYKACRHPSVMSVAYVVNPYDNDALIECHCAAEYRRYTNGLRQFQHNAVLKEHSRLTKRPINGPSDLERAMRSLEDEAEKALENKVLQKPKTKYAAWHGTMHTKRDMDRIVEVPSSKSASSKRLDPGRPFVAPTTARADGLALHNDAETAPEKAWEYDEDGALTEADPLKHHVARHEEGRDNPKTDSSSDIDDDDDDIDIETLKRMYKGFD